MKHIFTILLAIVPMKTFAESELSTQQNKILNELSRCLKSLPDSGNEEITLPCAEKPVAALSGVSRSIVSSFLGSPRGCVSVTGNLHIWSERECLTAPKWVYSFYYLPPSTLGGGPELVFSFEPDQSVGLVSWELSQ